MSDELKPAIWYCKIGEISRVCLPEAADLPMRKAVEKAFFKVTGFHAQFNFSGWGGELSEEERAVVEDREPVDFQISGDSSRASEQIEEMRSAIPEVDMKESTKLLYYSQRLRTMQREIHELDDADEMRMYGNQLREADREIIKMLEDLDGRIGRAVREDLEVEFARGRGIRHAADFAITDSTTGLRIDNDDRELSPAEDLCSRAWVIIANANGGDWDSADPKWKMAAERWRDDWHYLINKMNFVQVEEPRSWPDTVEIPARLLPDGVKGAVFDPKMLWLATTTKNHRITGQTWLKPWVVLWLLEQVFGLYPGEPESAGE